MVTDVGVTIAGSACDVVSVTETIIVCTTGSYQFSSTRALVQVYVRNVGLAINVTILLFITTLSKKRKEKVLYINFF